MLSSVVGNSEAVIKTTDLDLFKRLMKFVSVTASMLVSQSTTTETVSTGKDIMEQAKDELGVPAESTVHLDDDEYDKEDDSSSDVDDDWDDGEW